MRTLKLLLTLLIVLPLLAFGAGLWWLQQPLGLPAVSGQVAPLEVDIEPGASARTVANRLSDAGVQAPPTVLYAWFRLSGRERDIKAGSYALQPGVTPRTLLNQLVRGEQAFRSITLLEGWSVREVLAAVRSAPEVTQDLEGLDPEAVMAKLGYAGRFAEGRFFPDTYRVAKNASASSVLKQAANAMDQRLAEAWAQRTSDTPLRSADEALALASIVEKETGTESDRPLVAAVFANRLRLGMRLQTDPTVIYGLGERFDGNLRKQDLLDDTPYNTYTRAGLPPTPIAMPGWNSLLAAVQPGATKALYFVARGDGSSQFSASLEEHNAAVQRYQSGR